MELNDYQAMAMSTCMTSSHNYTYMAEGMLGEMGEFFSKVAKAVRKDEAMVFCNELTFGHPNLKDKFTELEAGLKAELGDILWFVAGLADVMGWSLEEIAEANVAKLASRQKRGVIDGNGDNR